MEESTPIGTILSLPEKRRKYKFEYNLFYTDYLNSFERFKRKLL
jgi:hypothetical protein